MWLVQEQPLLHAAEFFTEGVGRFSVARTRAGGLICLWIPIMEEHRGWSLQGTELQIRESSIFMSGDCPGNLGFLRRMQLESGTSYLQTHSSNPSGLCLLLKDSSVAIPVSQLLPSSFLLLTGRGVMYKTAPWKGPYLTREVVGVREKRRFSCCERVP